VAAAQAAQHRSQTYFASVFAARMASSHALNTYLVWLAFTSKSVSTAGWVLVARAVSALVVPAVVGHVHDRGRIGPWLRVCAVVEAVGAITLAWVGWHGAAAWAMVGISLALGATSSLFDTAVYPLLLTGTPGRLRPHVMVGLSYDVAKVVGSSLVLALLAVWHSPWPVMCASVLSLAGWRLTDGRVPDVEPDSAGSTVSESVWRSMPLGPVVALAIVSLLPAQVSVFQWVSAHHSFGRYGVLGTVFALGAVTGNLILQRMRSTHALTAVAYVCTAVSLVASVWQAEIGFFGYGISVATYYQLTRVLVIEAAPIPLRGRVSAAMTAPTKLVAVVGGAMAPHLVQHRTALYGVVVAVCALCAVSALSGRRPNSSRIAAATTSGMS
jgi:MFS family permease